MTPRGEPTELYRAVEAIVSLQSPRLGIAENDRKHPTTARNGLQGRAKIRGGSSPTPRHDASGVPTGGSLTAR